MNSIAALMYKHAGGVLLYIILAWLLFELWGGNYEVYKCIVLGGLFMEAAHIRTVLQKLLVAYKSNE